MNEIEKAIKHFTRVIAGLKYLDYASFSDDSPFLKDYIKVRNERNRRRLRASRIAVEALEEQTEKAKGCEYCNTTQNRYLTDDIYMATTNSYGDKQRVLTSNNGMQYKTLGFCPMCGRDLRKAVAE